MKSKVKQITLLASGMHCASCELLIEKRLLQRKGIEVAEASKGRGEVKISYRGKRPSLREINKLFVKENYKFFEKNKTEKKEQVDWKRTALITTVSVILIGGFLTLNRYGIASTVGVGTATGVLGFLVFGLMAGISSCAALVGGIVLSMSKQWGKRIRPHVLFNGGRLASYALAGLILGAVGEVVGLSTNFSSVLTFTVAGIMMILGLQMLGIKALQKISIGLPKAMTRKIVSDPLVKKDYVPATMGALTVFLPCGFTITTAGLAMTSGSAIRGMTMMTMFAVGTLPMLLLIGLSSMKILEKAHWSDMFLKIAGTLVVFLAVFNINSQLIARDWGGINLQAKTEADGLAAVKNGEQIIKMEALAYGYQPNYFKVKAGVPVRWEIEDKGTSGCTNAVISRGLFEGEIRLVPGETSVKEFTPKEPGTYRFSCWMGMVSGTIEVVGSKGEAANNLIDSGAQGCGGATSEGFGSGACGCGGGQ